MLDAFDERELMRVARDAVGQGNVKDLLGRYLGRSDSPAVDLIAAHCTVDHHATLVFPDSLEEVRNHLSQLGFSPADPVPSVVVRQRLSQRYGIPETELGVNIVRAKRARPEESSVGLEVFCLAVSPAVQSIVVQERNVGNERHAALLVRDPYEALLDSLRDLMWRLGMRPDGGGYNPHDEAAHGGRTALYFIHPTGGRLELTCAGDFSGVVARHTGVATLGER